MLSNLRPFSFVFILGKRKNHKGARSREYGGWDTTGIFFEPKTLEWKGRYEQEHFHGEEINHFENAGGVFSEVFPLIAACNESLPMMTQHFIPLPSTLIES
jgi:hypothetical protein